MSVAQRRLGRFWSGLVRPTGQKVLYVVGDSNNSEVSQYSMMQGWKDMVPLKYNGVFLCAGAANTVSWGYSNGQGSPPTNRLISPLGATYGGFFAPVNMTSVAGIPVVWRELTWGSNPTNCNENILWVNYINQNASGLGRNPGRDTWWMAAGEAVTARHVFIQNTRNLGSFDVVGRKYTDGGSGSAQATASYTKSAIDDSLTYKDVSCGTATAPTNNNRGVFVNN